MKSQKHIRKYAEESAEYVLRGFGSAYALNDAEITVLKDAAIQLFVKYYNGRDIKLLTKPYVVAEVIDLILERELPKTSSMELAVARFAIAFKEFIKHNELAEIQMITMKTRKAFLDYAIKKLEGKRAPRPPDMQADYDRLVAALSQYFGVRDDDNH